MKFLLPIDIQNPSRRAPGLVGCMGAGLGEMLERLTVMTVLAGQYLKAQVKNLDLRAERLIESEKIKELRQLHIEREVRPVLEEFKDMLRGAGIKGSIDEKVVDGDPVEKICDVVKNEGYTHIFMERRGLGEIKEWLLGSVSAGLLHRDLQSSLYLIGKKLSEHGPCIVERCLIPIDGSHHSELAVSEAATMVSHCAQGFKEVILLHVVNIARYPERVENGHIPEKEGEAYLDRAEETLIKAGIPKDKIKRRLEYGEPAAMIVEEIEKGEIDLVFMGRRGRSTIQEFFIGSVSSEVIHKCYDPTFALVTE